MEQVVEGMPLALPHDDCTMLTVEHNEQRLDHPQRHDTQLPVGKSFINY